MDFLRCPAERAVPGRGLERTQGGERQVHGG